MSKNQPSVNVEEKVGPTAKNGKSDDLFPGPLVRCQCTICEADFDKPEGSRREVCSFRCKVERSRRYSRQYQADGKRMLAELRRQFGGRAPIEDEIMEIIKRRNRT
jgi:hypothetical protein